MTLNYWRWGDITNNNFQNEFQEGCIELTPDAGVPFKRQRFTSVQELIQGTFILSKVQYLDFLSWYKFNIKQGSEPFQYLDTRTNEYKETRIIGKPKISTVSNMYNINVQFTFTDGGA